MTDNSSAGAYIKHKDYILVQVPEDAKHIHVNTYDNDLVYSIMEGWRGIDLPPGTWQLIGLAAEVTEGQWREIVQDDYGVLPDFEHMGMIYQSAIHSAASLLRSHNINANQTVILKLIEV